MRAEEPANARSAQSRDYEAGWLYAQVHSRRSRGLLSSWQPWLLASVAVHAILFVALAQVAFGSRTVMPKAVIQLDTDIVELFRDAPVTHRSVIDMEEVETTGGRAAELKKALTGSSEPVALMKVEKVRPGDLDLDLLGSKSAPRTTDWTSRADLTQSVDTGGRDHRSVLNVLSQCILSDVSAGRLLVVILFDESRSLLRERALMNKQLERTFNELKFAMSDRQHRRLSWAVVSYSEKPRVHLKPTRDTEKVRQALGAMPVDESGQENVLKAVSFAVEEFKKGADRKIIVVVTDEQGDDVGLGPEDSTSQKKALERTVEACRKATTRVYVLGREAMLLRASLWVFAEELGRGGNLERGLPTCRREVPSSLHYLLMGSNSIPSGFGCYSLSLLADKTKGQFLILSTEAPRYKDANLERYAPEWAYPDTYDERTRKSKLRSGMVKIIAEMNEDLPPYRALCEENYGTQRVRWRELIKLVDKKVEWCDDSTKELRRLEGALGKEDHARRHWEANHDLLTAHVLKLKAMLLQLREPLVKLEKRDRHPLDWPDDRDMAIGYRVGRADPATRPELARGRKEDDALRAARQALERVARKHPGTPWAESARAELRTMVPLGLTFTIQPRNPRYGPHANL
jgi:Mg-chelatase subunit ChlD